jgi:hypothetical protein
MRYIVISAIIDGKVHLCAIENNHGASSSVVNHILKEYDFTDYLKYCKIKVGTCKIVAIADSIVNDTDSQIMQSLTYCGSVREMYLNAKKSCGFKDSVLERVFK